MEPFTGTAGSRKAARREVREYLGTTRDPAPEALYTLIAAQELSALLFDASAGRFRLTVYDETEKRWVTFADARQIARGG